MKIHLKKILSLSSICLASQLQLLTAATPDWLGTTANLNTPANWSTAAVPTTGDTASFSNTASNFLPTLTGGGILTTDTFLFTPTAPTYRFTISGAGTNLTLGTNTASTGVNNTSSIFKVFTIDTGAQMNFVGSSSADVSEAEDITYHIDNASAGAPSQLLFSNSSTASTGIIKPDGNSSVSFINNSSPASSFITVTNGASVTFNTTNSVSTAHVNLTDSSAIIAQDITLNYINASLPTSNVEIQNGSTLTLGDTATRTLAAQISESGGSGKLVKQNSGNLFLSNSTNNYTGGTEILEGSLVVSTSSLPVAADLSPVQVVSTTPSPTTLLFAFPSSSQTYSGDINLDGANAVLGVSTTAILSGNITGTGIVAVPDTGELTLTGTNTYTGNTGVNGILHTTAANLPVGANILTNQSIGSPIPLVDFTTTAADETFSGKIQGVGKVQLSGPGHLTFTGENTYTGGTSVLDGKLTGTTLTVPVADEEPSIAISENGTFEFNQNFDGTYIGSLSGSGTFQKTGGGILSLTTSSPDFAGTTEVTAGGLNLNALLGGNIKVIGASISGNGTVGGNLSLQGNSVIAPGNSIGTIFVNGTYSQTSTDVYQVEYNGAGDSDLIRVLNSANLAGTVEAISLDGVINPANRYLIMDIDGTVTGAFENVVSTNNRIAPSLIYETTPNHTNIFLTVQSVYNFIAQTFNQRQIGLQLASITNPSAELNAILDELAVLASSPATINLARLAYDQMSGVQYADAFLTAETNNRQFLRRLYDPLRSIVTTPSCCCEELCCAPAPSLDTWLELGGGQKRFDGNKNVHSFRTDSFEVTGGIQSTIREDWTFGLAGSYVNDRAHYNKLGGYGKSNTGFAGIYGLYRPNTWYVLADATFGYSENKIKRKINIGALEEIAKGKPKIYQAGGYIEAGFDASCSCVLLQPFAGLELGYLKRNCVRENGDSPLNLNVNGKRCKNAYSRLGMHLTSDRIWANTFLSLDLAWQCRLTSFNNTLRQRFQSFGNEFLIKGLNLGRNSMDWALTSSTFLGYNWEVYAEASGVVYSKSCVYDLLGGIKFSW